MLLPRSCCGRGRFVIARGLMRQPPVLFRGCTVLSERVAIFIDGNNFYHRLKDLYGQIRIDYAKFAELLCRDRVFTRAHFYIAEVKPKHGKELYDPHRAFMNYLGNVPYYVIRYGRLEKAGNTFVEKAADVYLATDMLRLAYTNAYDTAILVSSDGDFVPAVEAVKELGKHVEVAFMLKTRSHHLRQVCNVFIPIDSAFLNKCKVRKR